MTPIKQQDLIQSVADALQHISYYHPLDYIQALGQAYQAEASPAAKDAIAQILTNSRMCAEGHRPICQDTGIVVVFVKVGMNVRWADATMSVTDMVNEGVRRAYLHSDNKLRASILADPAGKRTNTKDNTPAVVHYDIVPGDTVEVKLAAKGGGSENKSKFTMLNPSDSIVDWVLKTVPTMGAGWCPPGMLGIGIGGSAEKAMVLAKEALMETIDMHELKARAAGGAKLSRIEELRLELYDKVNALGIGAQGLGGLSTVLDVKILDYPTHAASLPVAIIPNCAATRHAHFTLDGSGAAKLEPPDPKAIKLKDPKDWKIAGKAVKRIDTADKLDGSKIYGVDIKLPGMLCAAIKDCPVFGGKVASYDEAKIAGRPGVRKVVKVKDTAVAVVADTWWRAKTALDALPIVWDEGPNASVSSASIAEQLKEGLGASVTNGDRQNGDALKAIETAAKKIEAVYGTPFLAHATMEPMNATVRLSADKAEVWVPTQNAEASLAAL